MKRWVLGLLVVAAGCGNKGVTTQSGAAACITASACGLFTGGISQCTQFIALVNDPQTAAAAHLSASEVNCIASAGSDCTAARKCLGGGNTPAVCSGSSTSCAGNTWQSCTDLAGSGGQKGMQLFDCGSVGEMCVANNGDVDCGFGTCAGGTMNTCVTPDGTPGGNLVQSCNNGIIQRQDCTKIASSCNPSGIFGAHCRGNGPACQSPSLTNNTLRCDGTVLVTCEDGQEARRDCAEFNLGCFPNPNGNGGFNCYAANQCDPNNYTAQCVGTKLTFCNKGQIQTIDCASSGFSTCSPNGGGSCGL